MDCILGKFRIPINSPQILLLLIWSFPRLINIEFNYRTAQQLCQRPF